MSNSFVADFKPHVPTGSFRRWLEKAVPAVYDESLSYYELVTKLLKYCGDMLEQVDLMGENTNSVYMAYLALEQYVKETFDVPSEVAKAMDEAATNGTFDKLLLPIVENYVPYVGENGNWFVNGTDTGVSGHGLPGTDGGYYVPNVYNVGDVATFTFVGSKEGMEVVPPVRVALPKGESGTSPHIGSNGNWFVGDTDTGVSAKGKDGSSITIKSTQNVDGQYTLITFSDGTLIRVTNGRKGADGEDGGYYTIMVVDNGDGTVTFNFAPSKSSMDSVNSVTVALPKGDKGDAGDKGDKGDKGDTGSKGADGYNPVRGVDYYTEADKAEIVAMVIESLGGRPVSAVMDENNNIILSGVANGNYTLKFQYEDGTYSDGISVVVGDIPEPEPDTPDEPTGYTNLADPASADWLENTRLATAYGNGKDCAGHTLTNYIPAKMGDVLRVKGLSIAEKMTDKSACVAYYKADKTYQGYLDTTTRSTVSAESGANEQVTVNGDVFTYTVMLHGNGTQKATAETGYIRIDGIPIVGYTPKDVVITINEDIV